MDEPKGLSLSLDDLIKKNQAQQQRGNRSSGPTRGKGRGFGPQGGVQKQRSPVKFGTREGQQRSGGRDSYGRGGRGSRTAQYQDDGQQGNRQRDNYSSRGSRGGYRGRGRGHHNQQQGGTAGGHEHGNGHQRFGQSFRQQQHVDDGDTQMDMTEGPATAAAPATTAYHPVVEVWLDEETSNVVATHKQTNIVTISPDGTILLDTGGWFTRNTFTAMNEALGYLDMKVTLSGDVSEPRSWSAIDSASMKKFTGNTCILPAKGPASAVRGELLYNAYNNPEAYTLTQQANAASIVATSRLPGVAAAGMGMTLPPGFASQQMGMGLAMGNTATAGMQRFGAPAAMATGMNAGGIGQVGMNPAAVAQTQMQGSGVGFGGGGVGSGFGAGNGGVFNRTGMGSNVFGRAGATAAVSGAVTGSGAFGGSTQAAGGMGRSGFPVMGRMGGQGIGQQDDAARRLMAQGRMQF